MLYIVWNIWPYIKRTFNWSAISVTYFVHCTVLQWLFHFEHLFSVSYLKLLSILLNVVFAERLNHTIGGLCQPSIVLQTVYNRPYYLCMVCNTITTCLVLSTLDRLDLIYVCCIIKHLKQHYHTQHLTRKQFQTMFYLTF